MPENINWDDPTERAGLIERIGIDAYNKAAAEHRKESTICTVAGHPIRPSYSFRFGPLFLVGDTGVAYSTLADAEKHARENPRP